MTDQQTSRTNIAEALDTAWADMLLDACASDGPIRDADVREAMKRGRPKIEALLAAEPRSDAVTAPDEPSLETHVALGRLLSRVQSMYADWPTTDMEIEADIAQAKVAIEREARAASASVPPLERAALIAEEHAERLKHTTHHDGLGMGWLAGEEMCREIARRIRAYAAETPEQGRGDE